MSKGVRPEDGMPLLVLQRYISTIGAHRKEKNDMKLEASVRPVRCNAAIFKEGKRITGEMITMRWSRCTIVPMDWRGFAAYGIYPNTKSFMHCICFWQPYNKKRLWSILKEYFWNRINQRLFRHAGFWRLRMKSDIWRYFVALLKSVLASMQLDEKNLWVMIVMKINTELSSLCLFKWKE